MTIPKDDGSPGRSIVTSDIRMSHGIAALSAAMAVAQGQMEGAKKDSNNPFFKSKYADLASVWDACREPLSKAKLAIIQLPGRDADGYFVDTILAHASGEYIASRLHIKPSKDDPQGLGSAITYARRYGLQAMVGIAPEDDDGEGAMSREQSGWHQPAHKGNISESKEPTDEEKRLGNIAKLQAHLEPSRPKGMTVNGWEQMFCEVAADYVGHEIEGVGIMLDAFSLEELRQIYSHKADLIAKLVAEVSK